MKHEIIASLSVHVSVIRVALLNIILSGEECTYISSYQYHMHAWAACITDKNAAPMIFSIHWKPETNRSILPDSVHWRRFIIWSWDFTVGRIWKRGLVSFWDRLCRIKLQSFTCFSVTSRCEMITPTGTSDRDVCIFSYGTTRLTPLLVLLLSYNV